MSVVMQTAMASASSTADSAVLQKIKEQVESTLDKLLTGFKEKACIKLTLCERRQAQKVQLEGVLAVSSDLPAAAAPASGLSSVPQSAAELASFVADNDSKLTSCLLNELQACAAFAAAVTASGRPGCHKAAA